MNLSFKHKHITYLGMTNAAVSAWEFLNGHSRSQAPLDLLLALKNLGYPAVLLLLIPLMWILGAPEVFGNSLQK